MESQRSIYWTSNLCQEGTPLCLILSTVSLVTLVPERPGGLVQPAGVDLRSSEIRRSRAVTFKTPLVRVKPQVNISPGIVLRPLRWMHFQHFKPLTMQSSWWWWFLVGHGNCFVVSWRPWSLSHTCAPMGFLLWTQQHICTRQCCATFLVLDCESFFCTVKTVKHIQLAYKVMKHICI